MLGFVFSLSSFAISSACVRLTCIIILSITAHFLPDLRGSGSSVLGFLLWEIAICRTTAVEENCERSWAVWTQVGTCTAAPPPPSQPMPRWKHYPDFAKGEEVESRWDLSSLCEVFLLKTLASCQRVPQGNAPGNICSLGLAWETEQGRQVDVWFPKRVWKTFYTFTTVSTGGRWYVSRQSRWGMQNTSWSDSFSSMSFTICWWDGLRGTVLSRERAWWFRVWALLGLYPLQKGYFQDKYL